MNTQRAKIFGMAVWLGKEAAGGVKPPRSGVSPVRSRQAARRMGKMPTPQPSPSPMPATPPTMPQPSPSPMPTQTMPQTMPSPPPAMPQTGKGQLTNPQVSPTPTMPKTPMPAPSPQTGSMGDRPSGSVTGGISGAIKGVATDSRNPLGFLGRVLNK